MEVVLHGYADSNASGCHKSLMVMMAVPQRLAGMRRLALWFRVEKKN